MSQTIFQRVGGFSTVSQVVIDFYDRILDSDKVGDFFEDVDLTRLIDHQTKFISALMGGPASYSDEQLERTHADLGIDKDSFDEMVSILCDTLSSHGLEAKDVDYIRHEMERRRAIIVTA